MRPFQGLIFDMDGLMVDTESLYWECEYRIARERGVSLSVETLHRMMGRKPLESIRVFCRDLGLDDDPAELLDYRDSIMREKMRENLQPLPGLFEILDRFQNRIRLAIATGAHQEFMDLVVDKLDIRGVFDVLLCSDTINKGKPDPEIYLEASRLLGLEPERCIVLEDTENGCRAAAAAGCHTIAVPSEYTRGQDFSMADAVKQDLREAGLYIETELGLE